MGSSLINTLGVVGSKESHGMTVALFFGGIILCSILLASVIYFLGRAAFKRRHLRRKAWGEQHFYSMMDSLPTAYAPNDISRHVLATYPHVWFFQHATAHAFNILSGSENGELLRVFDYSYITGSGRSTVEHKYSVVAVQLPEQLPALIFRKRVLNDRFAGLRGEEFVLTGNDLFDDRFRVQWDVGGILPGRLDNELIEHFSNSIAREYFVSGWQCVVVTHNHLKDEHYDQLLGEALWFSQWLLGKSTSYSHE